MAAARAEIVENNGAMELAAVAERAGVSPGLPYRYFESKTALLVAVVDAIFDALDEAVYRPVFDEASDDWWDREKLRLEKWVGFFYEDPLACCVMTQLAGDAAVAQARQRRLSRHVRGATLNIKKGKTLRRVPPDVDAELAGALLIGGAHEVIGRALNRKPRMRANRVARQLQAFMRDVLRIEE